MNKAELRKQLKLARLSMPPRQWLAHSRAIKNRLSEALDWTKVSSVHYFEPIKELAEVNISGFLPPDVLTFTSRRENEGNDWSIVPVGHDQETPEEFDAIIVPMLGFDPASLQRIGYGGGYYDRLLATQPRALKIGVSFEQGKVPELPIEDHDMPLDMIVTEKAVYQR